MTKEIDTQDDAIDAVQLLEEMRGEVTLCRRAVEGLTAARENIPDYSITLGQMAESLNAAHGRLGEIETSPAIKLSPGMLTAEIVKAGADARTEDGRMLNAARDTLSRSIGRIDGIVERGQAADKQWRQLVWCAIGGVLSGMLLWAMLPGVIARSLPESWYVPEWMAARTMAMSQRAAGQRMIAAANGV